MSGCACKGHDLTASSHVPDFSVHGFATKSQAALTLNRDVLALKLQACVGASYSNGQICFSFPIIGQICFQAPISIPVGASLKVCGETCGSFIPTGLKITLYLNNNPVWSGVVWGSC